MSRDTETKRVVLLTDKKCKYDDMAKRILGTKIVIAHILVNTLDEFGEMLPEDVVSLIEGEPYVGVVPIDLGLTNAVIEESGERIIGFNTESVEVNEGICRFDIVFYIRRKSGLQKMIINIEAQMSETEEYHLVNRGIFYCCRLISSQKGRNFTHMDYDAILPVYSIWIVMNCKDNCFSHIHLKEDELYGDINWEGLYDAINLFMIGLGQDVPKREEDKKLHRLLGTLFSETMTSEEKLQILEMEYGIPMDYEMREEVSEMCNLSEYFIQRGIERGIEQGIATERERSETLLAEKDAIIEKLKGQLEKLNVSMY